ncbi:unnamed protein product [Hymenolepis diminuta]|uniref:DBD_Tnp_Mut domain-containing protein n=1 Tax=Hymenolepis diminuta TaxID=6216 RepID=A0A0R3SZ01_HYMDI|nr:unnamed protein product [Hymenolepis diminuta]
MMVQRFQEGRGLCDHTKAAIKLMPNAYYDFHMEVRQADCLPLLIYNQKCPHKVAVVASLTMEDDA